MGIESIVKQRDLLESELIIDRAKTDSEIETEIRKNFGFPDSDLLEAGYIEDEIVALKKAEQMVRLGERETHLVEFNKKIREG